MREGRSGFWPGIPTRTHARPQGRRGGGERGAPPPQPFPAPGVCMGRTACPGHQNTAIVEDVGAPPPPPRFLPSGEKVNQTASSTTRKRCRHRARPPRQAPHHGGTRASRGGRGAGPGEDQHRLRGRWVRRGRAGVRPPALVQPRRPGHALRARELSPCVSINFLHFSLCLGRKPNKWSGSESMPCF